jgi:hypothetical protein
LLSALCKGIARAERKEFREVEKRKIPHRPSDKLGSVG